MTAETFPLRPELAGVEPYGAPQLDVPVALNTNENPYPPSPALTAAVGEAVAEAAAGLNRYPDREAARLRAGLADYLARDLGPDQTLDASRVWAANGSNEVMLQILQAFGGPGRRAMSFAPTYSMYPEYARDTFTEWLTGSRRSDFTIDPAEAAAEVRAAKPSVVFVASPNNPTGTAVPLETVRALCEAAPGIVVVDEAYAEFRRDGVPSAVTLLDQYPRLIVTRTMSKAFSLAGLRVGYLAAGAPVVDALRVVRLPYHLSAVTQTTALTALRFTDELLGRVDELRGERDRLVEWLRARGFRVADSDANFVLVGEFEDRHRVWQGLLDQGVLVRETGPSGWLRVSVGTPDEMTAFTAALEGVADERIPR